MAANWYVLHVYSGYENRIEKTIRSMIERGELEREFVKEIKIPTEEYVEVKDGKKHTRTRKYLPGYILMELDLPDPGWEHVCSKIKSVQGVTSFVGTTTGKDKKEQKPNPISADEARVILQKSGEIKGERPIVSRQTFSVGEQVKIIDGPFELFIGTIDEVNVEKNRLKVMVGIFGRNTPVEVDLLQVEKV